MDQYSHPGCGSFYVPPVHICLIRGLFSEYSVSGQSKSCSSPSILTVFWILRKRTHSIKNTIQVQNKTQLITTHYHRCYSILLLSPLNSLFMSLPIALMYAESKSVAPLCDLLVLMIHLKRVLHHLPLYCTRDMYHISTCKTCINS